jgi:hypothetical protein
MQKSIVLSLKKYRGEYNNNNNIIEKEEKEKGNNNTGKEIEDGINLNQEEEFNNNNIVHLKKSKQKNIIQSTRVLFVIIN